MQSLFRTFLLSLAAIAVSLGLGACSLAQKSSPSSFYVLSAVRPQGQEPLFAPGAPQEAPQAPVLILSAVRIAAFLDRPQVTLRSDGNAVNFDEFVRWAEPLGDGVARVLRANFVDLLGTPESALPWVGAGNRDFNLFVLVEDIQLLADNRLELRLSFRLNDGESNRILLTGERTYDSVLPQSDDRNATFAALAEVLSAQLGQFSVDVARDAVKLKAAAESAVESAASPTSGSTTEPATGSAASPTSGSATEPAAGSAASPTAGSTTESTAGSAAESAVEQIAEPTAGSAAESTAGSATESTAGQ